MRQIHMLFMVVSSSAMLIVFALAGLYAAPAASWRSIAATIRVAAIICAEETKFIADKNDYCGANEKLCDGKTTTVTLTSHDITTNGKTTAANLEVWLGGTSAKGKLTMDYSDCPDGCKSITNYQGSCGNKSGKQFTTSIDGGAKAYLEIMNCTDFVWIGPCAPVKIFGLMVHIPEGEQGTAKDLELPLDEGGYAFVLGEFWECRLDPAMKMSVRCDGGSNTTMLITPSAVCPGSI